MSKNVKIKQETLYRVESDMGLPRRGGGSLKKGNYDKAGNRGKLWHRLGDVKRHYLNCQQSTSVWDGIKIVKIDVSKVPDDMPSDIVIEYKLVEVRRFPAKDLFKAKAKGKCKCSLDDIIEGIKDVNKKNV